MKLRINFAEATWRNSHFIGHSVIDTPAFGAILQIVLQFSLLIFDGNIVVILQNFVDLTSLEVAFPEIKLFERFWTLLTHNLQTK